MLEKMEKLEARVGEIYEQAQVDVKAAEKVAKQEVGETIMSVQYHCKLH